MGNKKLQVWLPLIFSVIMILGMLMGYKMGNQAGGQSGFFSGNNRSTFQQAIELIKMKYVDAVPVDSLESTAIEEMMSELDPPAV